MVEHGVIFKAHRAGVFVENTPPMPKLLGSNIIGVSRRGRDFIPITILQRYRADGATDSEILLNNQLNAA